MAIAKAYDDVIMDHIKNARGYRALDGATHTATGTNPLCGDEVTVYVSVEGDRIVDIGFQCACCGICMASASIMTESVAGHSVTDARRELNALIDGLAAAATVAPKDDDPARLALLNTAQAFPSRTRCATLPWVTLEAALDNRGEAILR
jgi:nitrogen fixation NifU-like protein